MHEKIRTLIQESQKESDEWDKRMVEFLETSQQLKNIKTAEILPNMRQAKARDYKKWLKGFLELGGTPTHSYDYRFNRKWYVAKQDFKLGDLCGSLSMHVIVPKGVNFLGGAMGHCNVFYMDGFRAHDPGFVPVYCDTQV